MQTVETSSGNQHSRSAKTNCETSAPPYGYGGRRADQIVFPVRIIMSPNSSSTCRAGTNARSATLRTIFACPSSGRGRWSEELYAMRPPCATHDRRSILASGPSRPVRTQPPPLISCADREGTESLWSTDAARRLRRAARERLWRRDQAGRGRTRIYLEDSDLQPDVSPQPGDRASDVHADQGGQRRHQDDPKHRRHDRLLLLHEHLSQPRREQAPDLGGRTGAGSGPQPPRSESGHQ